MSSMAISDAETPPFKNMTDNRGVDNKEWQASRRDSGGWRSASFIIGAVVAESFAFNGIGGNLILYLTGPVGLSIADAAVNVNVWNSATKLLPLLCAFIAESFLGCYRTIILASVLYVLGLGLMTLSTIMPSDCQSNHTTSCSPPIFKIVFFFSLYLVAAAQSGHNPCVQAFGADQFDSGDKDEAKAKSSFFNWLHFGVSFSALMTFAVVSYMQENFSWGLGFGIPCNVMVLAFITFLLGTKTYTFSVKQNKKGPFIRIFRVFVAAFENRHEKQSYVTANIESDKLESHQCSQQFKFLNKALKAPKDVAEGGRLCSATEVEEAKAVLRLLPIWFSCLIYGIVFTQPRTFFIKQTATLDRTIFSGFKLPAASFQCLSSSTIMVVLPIYDRILVPTARYFTGKPSGITMLQRTGTGLFISVIVMIVAALVAMKRLRIVGEHGLVNEPNATIPMSLWWMAPQTILFGVTYALTVVGMQEFFYDQVPPELKSIGIALYFSVLGVGGLLSSFVVMLIKHMTGGDGQDNWLSNNLNNARLDCFYWVVAGLSALGLMSYVHFARSYVYNSKGL